MRIGIVEVLGAEEVNNILEAEFEKEVQTLQIKRQIVPTIDDAALGAKKLVQDSDCDIIVIGYELQEKEKLSEAFQQTVLHAQYELKRDIFRVIVPSNQNLKEYTASAAKEILRYHYKPYELQHEVSEKGGETDSFSPFAMFG